MTNAFGCDSHADRSCSMTFAALGRLLSVILSTAFGVGFVIAFVFYVTDHEVDCKKGKQHYFFTISKTLTMPYYGILFAVTVGGTAVATGLGLPLFAERLSDAARPRLYYLYAVSMFCMIGLCTFRTNLCEKADPDLYIHFVFALSYFGTAFIYYGIVLLYCVAPIDYQFGFKIGVIFECCGAASAAALIIFYLAGESTQELAAIFEWIMAVMFLAINDVIWYVASQMRDPRHFTSNIGRQQGYGAVGGGASGDGASGGGS